MISVKLGIRNLTRNRWRSALTLAAVAVSVALMVWTLAFYEGWLQEMVRGATAVELAQVQLHTASYVESPRVYRSFPLNDDMLDEIAEVDGVVAMSPRVKANGLLGNEARSQVVRIMGVDPVREGATTPVPEAIVAGRWLAPDPAPFPAPREVVIGEGVARQLQVEPGAELVVFLEASDGSLGNDLLQVVGVVRTANTQVDRLSVYVHIEDAQFLTALDGRVHEIAVRTDNLSRARETAATIAAVIGAHLGEPTASESVDDDTIVVQPWQEIAPSINQMIVLFRRSYWIMYLLVYLVAAVGIVNTQRMSALERQREFGVMMAIGMRPRRMFRTLQVETLVIGLVGGLIGAAVGGLVAWYHARVGLNLTFFTDQATFSYMGVAFSDRIHFLLGAGSIVTPILVMLFVAALSGLWPAIRAARIDPAPTISGRQG